MTDIEERIDPLIEGQGTNSNLLTKVKRKMEKLKIPYSDVQLSTRPTKNYDRNKLDT